jgi:hypothetical protein
VPLVVCANYKPATAALVQIGHADPGRPVELHRSTPADTSTRPIAWGGAAPEGLDDDHAAAAAGTRVGERLRLAVVAGILVRLAWPRWYGEQCIGWTDLAITLNRIAVGRSLCCRDITSCSTQNATRSVADELKALGVHAVGLRGEWQIRVETHMRLTSTGSAFPLQGSLRAFEGPNEEVCRRDWDRSIPRDFL